MDEDFRLAFRDALQEMIDEARTQDDAEPSDLLALLEEQCETLRGEIRRQAGSGAGVGPQRGEPEDEE